MNIESEVLDRIKPTTEEDAEITKSVEELKEKVRRTHSFENETIELCLVGSIAKGTHLKSPDIDLFLLFDPTVPRDRLETLGVMIGKEAIDGEEHYAEHPYIRGTFNGFQIDMVPAYKVTEASLKMTAVDRTPFHTEYIIDNLEQDKKDGVRLLKGFMKGIGVYGAEIKTEGFSGYLCELLVLNYGSFNEVLEAACKWERGEVIRLDEKTGRDHDDPLVFIDPVDENRNVASPVSIDTLASFVYAAERYLESGTMKFFFPDLPQPYPMEEIKNKLADRADIIGISFRKPSIIDDIFYGQLRKFVRTVIQLLSEKKFKVMDTNYHVDDDNITIIFEIETRFLSKAMVHNGPPIWLKENARDFVAKWKSHTDSLSDPYIENGNWKVIIRRKYTDALELLQNNLQRLDIGKDLNKIKDELSIISDEKLLTEANLKPLSHFLDKRMPWEY